MGVTSPILTRPAEGLIPASGEAMPFGAAARAIKAGEADLVIAGGVESMTRAPFVMGKAETAFARSADIYDTTIGWRFINPLLKAQYGVDSMPDTAENVAEEFQVSRADQDAFALRSQQRAGAAQASGRLAEGTQRVSAVDLLSLVLLSVAWVMVVGLTTRALTVGRRQGLRPRRLW